MITELTWHGVLTEEEQQLYFVNALYTIAGERQSGMAICPPRKDVSNVFRFTELGGVKVAILGQDPYHGPGQAHGLVFSTRPGIATPPSLLNMYKELEATTPGLTRSTHGYLESWVRQGVLLLNTILIVHVGQTHSHASLGWETFTNKAISLINQHRKGVVFLLQGFHVQEEDAIIGTQHHHVLKAPHPSPFSAHRGFFDCNYLALVDGQLEQRGKKPIDWMLVLPVESE